MSENVTTNAAEQFAALLSQMMGPKVPADLLTRIEALESSVGRKMIVHHGADDETPVPLGLVHENMEDLINAISCGHVYLVGEAGSGKSTAGQQVAEALKMPFYSISAPGAESFSFFGYMNAAGEYVPTDFYRAYKDGGLFLIDEIDGGNASSILAINMALANNICSFPCGQVVRHENFRCIAAANTWGKGATRQYIGRNALDATTLDRFIFQEWNIDEMLEMSSCNNPTWCGFVQSIRAAKNALSLPLVVSMRASYQGAALLAKGMDTKKVAEMCIFKGMEATAKTQILTRAKAINDAATSR